ncbi:MAG: YhdP family protein [Pseudomonadota bacterium]
MPLLPSPVMLTPSWRTVRIAVRVAGSLVLLAWGLFVVAWLVLHWAILPRIDHWRDDLERAASQALGLPAQIGQIRVESHGWVPTLELTDVRVRDRENRVALHLARVRAALSASSLVHLEPRFAQLVIDAPVLDVRRDARGRWSVAGLELGDGSSPGDGAEADWLFSQDEVVVRQGAVRWIDELRGSEPLVLSDVTFVLRNGGGLGSRRHEWRLDATPPADWGDRFSLRGRFTHPLLGRAGDVSRWSGTGYAELPHVDVRRLRQYTDLPFRLDAGTGALRLWAALRDGRPVEATLDAALREVRAQLVPDGDPLVLDSLEGRLEAQHERDVYRLAARQLAFRTGDGSAWPASDWQATWKAGSDDGAHDGEFRADRLDLALLAGLGERLPLGSALRRELAALAPAGIVHGLQVRWEGPIDAPQTYRAQGRVEGLHLAAETLDDAQLRARRVGRPGFSGADLQFEASEHGGAAQLHIREGALGLPGVFEEPEIPLDRLEARLEWTLTRPRGAAAGDLSRPAAVELRVRDARFANADAEGQFQAVWRTGTGPEGEGPGGRLPGVLELTGRLSRADAARTWRYLPLELPADVRDYVRRAVVAGRARQVDFRVKGDLWHFPYADARQGEFRIAAQIEDGIFAYGPAERGQTQAPWPAFTQVRGHLVFDRTSMRIEDARARLFGFELGGIRGGIADLMNDSVLVLEGHGKGPLADVLRFVKETPVDEWTHHALSKARGTGDAQLRLHVQIPLARMDEARVQGLVTLLGNEVQIVPDTPVMTQARGQVQFSDQGFAVRGASARVLGGEASFEGGTQKDGSMRFSGQGTASAEGMRLAREIAWLPYLAEHLRGQATYRATLDVTQEGVPQLQITSSLQGLAIQLPEPLAKSADASWPLRVQTQQTQPPAEGRPARDRLVVELAQRLHAQYERELAPEGARVLAGAIGLPHPVEPPARGVLAVIQPSRLDVDAWRAVAASFEGLAEGSVAATPSGAGGPIGQEDRFGFLPDRISLRADELTVDQRRLTRVVAGLTRDEDVWRANLVAEQLSGYVEYRPPQGRGSRAGGQVYARLSRLALPASAAEEVDSLLDQAPAQVPSLDIVVDDFQLHDLRLGRVEVEATNRRAGEIREWRLERLVVATPDARLSATGTWRGAQGTGARRRTDLDFELDIADAGALLDRFGLKQVVRRGKGKLEGRIGWLGSPLALDYSTLDGEFHIDVARGQFLKADPGIAKLAGILSLQSLPRRLTLDFRDVFQEGFAFDAFTGDVRIESGVARTNNLRLRGVTAAVLMEGQTDIDRETQDLRVVVVPEINAGTASLAYAVINPAIGLGTFLAQWFLRKPLAEASTREFHVTGTWTDPKVDAVRRRPGPGTGTGEGPVRPELARQERGPEMQGEAR